MCVQLVSLCMSNVDGREPFDWLVGRLQALSPRLASGVLPATAAKRCRGQHGAMHKLLQLLQDINRLNARNGQGGRLTLRLLKPSRVDPAIQETPVLTLCYNLYNLYNQFTFFTSVFFCLVLFTTPNSQSLLVLL